MVLAVVVLVVQVAKELHVGETLVLLPLQSSHGNKLSLTRIM